MGSNSKKCTFLETGAGGTWSGREGISLKGKAHWEWRPKGDIVGGWCGAHVARRRHYGIVNSYVPRMGIQADSYHSCNTSQ